MTADRKTAIVVAGYYRTGTSALSGVLAESGVTFLNETEANEHNPKGFYEDTTFIQLDMDVFAAIGGYWSDLRFLPEGWHRRQDVGVYRNRLIDACGAKFGAAKLIGLKHPHICRLFPLYEDALSATGYDLRVIMTHRDPYAIATSQKIKNGLARSHALLLWASYVLDAERHSRALPRAWVDYEALIENQKATAEGALARLGITIETPEAGFATKALKRSSPAPREGVFAPLAALVRDIEAAIAADAPAEIWDALRPRAAELVAFLAEITQTQNRILPGIGGVEVIGAAAQAPVALADTAFAHRVRPQERADDAAKRRILAALDAESIVPTVTVLVVAPAGREGFIQATLESIERNWWQPARQVVLHVGKTSKADGSLIGVADDDALAAALTERFNRDDGADYVAILNAGDTIEPDAIARFCLTIARAPRRPALVYCDEIVNNPQQPWVRTKPGWSPHRLREACFVGDWAWYGTAAVRAAGGLAATYPGADEYALQLAFAEAGAFVLRLTEAVFVRNGGSRRDNIPLDDAMDAAVRALDAHYARVWPGTRARRGGFPGIFAIEPARAVTPATIALVCAGASVKAINAALGRLLATLQPHDRVLLLAPDGASAGAAAPDGTSAGAAAPDGTSPGVRDFLDRVSAEVAKDFPALSVLADPGTPGGRLRLAAGMRADAHVLLIDAAATPERDDVADLLRAYLDGNPDIGVAALRAVVPGPDGKKLLHGPLLGGASRRLGHGRDAENPGPAGWLLSSQPVDAVDGPVVAVARPAGWLDGDPRRWPEICDAARAAGRTVVWRPGPGVLLAEAPGADPDLEIMRAREWSPENHHPALTLTGDPLLLEGRLGLIEETPIETGVVITGEPKRHPVDALRSWRRRANGVGAWAAEPLDGAAAARLRQGRRIWARVDPLETIPGGEGYVGIWTRLPELAAREAVLAAHVCFGTSEAIVRGLRGMGGKRVSLWRPGLNPEFWDSYQAPEIIGEAVRPVALWVNEGLAGAWMKDLIAATRADVSWVVASDTEIALPGDVSIVPVPVFQEGWASLLRDTAITTLVRPTPDTPWLDDYPILLALAADCRVIAGRESLSERLDGCAVTWLGSDRIAKWVAALKAAPSGRPGSAVALRQVASAWASREGFVEAWIEAGREAGMGGNKQEGGGGCAGSSLAAA